MDTAGDATEAVIVAGRRAGDGFMRLAVFTRELLEITVEAHGERSSTLLLTRAQINELQQTLTRLGAQLGAEMSGERSAPTLADDHKAHKEHVEMKEWDGMERRVTGQLLLPSSSGE